MSSNLQYYHENKASTTVSHHFATTAKRLLIQISLIQVLQELSWIFASQLKNPSRYCKNLPDDTRTRTWTTSVAHLAIATDVRALQAPDLSPLHLDSGSDWEFRVIQAQATTGWTDVKLKVRLTTTNRTSPCQTSLHLALHVHLRSLLWGLGHLTA